MLRGALFLFFLGRRFRRLIDDESLYPGEFLLEARDEVCRPVLEQNDETKGKKNE